MKIVPYYSDIFTRNGNIGTSKIKKANHLHGPRVTKKLQGLHTAWVLLECGRLSEFENFTQLSTIYLSFGAGDKQLGTRRLYRIYISAFVGKFGLNFRLIKVWASWQTQKHYDKDKPKMRQCSNCGNWCTIYNISAIIQYWNIHTDWPHLGKEIHLNDCNMVK